MTLPANPAEEPVPPAVDLLDSMEHAGARKVAAQQSVLPPGWRAADRAIVRTTEWGLFAIGATFTLMITLEVISRYVFSFSIFFVNAAARLLLVWFFLMGAGIALRHGAHVGFELLLTSVSARRRRAIVLVGSVLGLVFFAEMLWGGLYALGPAWRQIEPGLGISLVWPFLAIPVGFALMIYHMVVLIYVEVRQAPDGRARS